MSINRRTEEQKNVKCRSEGRPGLIARATSTSSVLYSSVLLFFGFFSSCRQAPPPAPVPAFYHWQTKLDLTAAENDYLSELQAGKLYVKAFDVDWDENRQQAVPLARLEVVNSYPAAIEYIPTVFITNRTLRALDPSAIPELASRIAKLLQSISEAAGWNVQEVQLDCDWTASTRDRFFQLLEMLRRQPFTSPPTILSATIRLHQVRYPARTGVPPVDRGMLMCYNVGDVSSWKESNSILRADEVVPYLEGGRYPLPLDVALPVFGWGVLFRQGRMIRLINGLSKEELTDSSRFTNLGGQRYELNKSTYLNGYYLYRGDRLRLEAAEPEALTAAASLLADWLPPAERTVAFYHLDTTTIKYFPNDELERIIETVAGKKIGESTN